MDVTIIVPMIEGRYDEDSPAEVISGHMTREEAFEFARQYGSGYPFCLVEPEYDGGFYASFSNSEEPELDEDGCIADIDKGHLGLFFHHTTVNSGGPWRSGGGT